MSVFS